jgi:cystathionine beta-lyase family protein involved in aluminum resistance
VLPQGAGGILQSHRITPPSVAGQEFAYRPQSGPRRIRKPVNGRKRCTQSSKNYLYQQLIFVPIIVSVTQKCTHILLRQLDHIGNQAIFVRTSNRNLALRGSVLPQNPASAAF